MQISEADSSHFLAKPLRIFLADPSAVVNAIKKTISHCSKWTGCVCVGLGKDRVEGGSVVGKRK